MVSPDWRFTFPAEILHEILSWVVAEWTSAQVAKLRLVSRRFDEWTRPYAFSDLYMGSFTPQRRKMSQQILLLASGTSPVNELVRTLYIDYSSLNDRSALEVECQAEIQFLQKFGKILQSMKNVTRVVWTTRDRGSRQMHNAVPLEHIVKRTNIQELVLLLPIAHYHDAPGIAYDESQIMALGAFTGLTKLTLECDIKTDVNDRQRVRTVVANCTQLTHLELSVKMGSADIFATAMTKGVILPLKHLLLRNTTDGLFDHAVISKQLRKLETFGLVNARVGNEGNDTHMDNVDWTFFQEMSIFPTSLLVETPFTGTHPFHAYLGAHPGLESLTIRNVEDWHPSSGTTFGCELVQILRTRHANSLRELDFLPHQVRRTVAFTAHLSVFGLLHSFRHLQYVCLRMNWDALPKGFCKMAEMDQEDPWASRSWCAVMSCPVHQKGVLHLLNWCSVAFPELEELTIYPAYIMDSRPDIYWLGRHRKSKSYFTDDTSHEPYAHKLLMNVVIRDPPRYRFRVRIQNVLYRLRWDPERGGSYYEPM